MRKQHNIVGQHVVEMRKHVGQHIVEMRKQHNIVGRHVVEMRNQHNIVGQHVGQHERCANSITLLANMGVEMRKTA